MNISILQHMPKQTKLIKTNLNFGKFCSWNPTGSFVH